MGNQHPSIAPYELLPTQDGDLVLAVGNDRQFAAMCDIVGAPELAGDVRFATNRARVENRSALRCLLVARLGRRPAGGWAKELTGAGVPAGVVNDVRGAFRLATELGLDPVVSLPREDGTCVELTRNPVGLSATPATYRTAPPRLGPHRAAAPARPTPSTPR